MNDLEKARNEITDDPARLMLVDGEASDRWSEFFQNNAPGFFAEMKKVFQMEDTFGLCGLICYQILGISRSSNFWAEEAFDVNDLKSRFNKFQEKDPDYPKSPAENFLQTRGDIFERRLVAVKSTVEIKQHYKHLQKNQCLYFAIVVNYPMYEGKYTHWISILEIKGDVVVIAGDLSPFGIRDSFIKEINLDELTSLIANTLLESPTTKNADTLKQAALDHGARDSERFTRNLGVATIISPITDFTNDAEWRFDLNNPIKMDLSKLKPSTKPGSLGLIVEE